MCDKAKAARATAARCIASACETKDLETQARYLDMAKSWNLIAEHHDARVAMDAKLEHAQ